jgi:uncharacterized protein YecE (DUF72 family)
MSHDPGPEAACERLEDLPSAPTRLRRAGHEILLGTAGWTDRTLTARGVFYPRGTGTPEGRLRYYASRFPLVEVDMSFYAIPDADTAARWVERTPDGFTFNVKAHALMTGHGTDARRLPPSIRDALPPDLATRRHLVPADLPPEVRREVWRLFSYALQPLAESGKLGAVLLQYPPTFQPSERTPAILRHARERMGNLPIAVEFRHPTWLESRVRERVWSLLRDLGMTYVVVDEPQGTKNSVPAVAAITTPALSIVRMHGRVAELWGAKGASVLEKYRYLYDDGELSEWIPTILELAEAAERVHVVFNNCYANYGVTNALEMGALLNDQAP